MLDTGLGSGLIIIKKASSIASRRFQPKRKLSVSSYVSIYILHTHCVCVCVCVYAIIYLGKLYKNKFNDMYL